MLSGLLLRREIEAEDLLVAVMTAIERVCGVDSVADSLDDYVDEMSQEEQGRYMLRSAHEEEIKEKDEEIEKAEKATEQANAALAKAEKEWNEEWDRRDEELALVRGLLGLPTSEILAEIEILREAVREEREHHAATQASDIAALRRVEESARERIRAAERAEWKLRTDAREALFAAYEATFRIVKEKARAAVVVAALDDLEKLATRIQKEAGNPNPGFMFHGGV